MGLKCFPDFDHCYNMFPSSIPPSVTLGSKHCLTDVPLQNKKIITVIYYFVIIKYIIAP